MKFSEKWLRQWVNIKVNTQELVDKFTMAGLEVNDIEAVSGEFNGVVIGEIITCEKHPDADKLCVTQVSIGSKSFQVVCSAPNAQVGIKVPFATVGAVLPGNFKIKKTKLRGVESFGMLCAEEELGMAESSDGLMELPLDAPVGQDIREYLSLDDKIIDVDLTPNRGDCLSIAGLAREISANFLADVTEELVIEVSPSIDDTFTVYIDAPKGCPRYVGRVIRNVDVSRSAPLWMTERLRRSGIRSIDPIVDVTNYVMLELGQPMHGFDLDTLVGSIHVRMAETEEKLTLLDGQDATLVNKTLVIADEQKALAIAGIMGGEDSGVSEKTRNIFLESAFFAPVAIAGKARSYGLHTESSHRFERGVDFQLQRKAVERATALIVDICGGEAGPVTEVTKEAYLPALHEVILHSEKVTSLLGMTIENSYIEALLSRLGLGLIANGDGRWKVSVPSWRFDISIEEDLVEELGRIYGYNNLPESTPTALLKMKQVDESQVQESDIRHILMARGYQEAVCFSFIAPELHKLFDFQHEPVALSNPIASDLSVMRTTLLPGLVKTANYNLNRQQSRIRLFETGLSFVKIGGELKQELMLAALITGSRHPESWQGKAETVDFFDLKGDFEAIFELSQVGNEFVFRKGEHAAMHPGQCAEIVRDGKVIGHMGALHPSLAKTMDMPAAVYLAELSLKAVTESKVSHFLALSKHPEVRRDLALMVNTSIAAGDIERAIESEVGELLRRVNTFDVYTGQGIEEGCKSLAMGLTFQHPSRTLKDYEVNELIDRIVIRLKQDFNAVLRQ